MVKFLPITIINFLLMTSQNFELTYEQAIAQSDYFGLSIQSKSITNIWLTIQIQIQFSKLIDNPIQIQSKDMG